MSSRSRCAAVALSAAVALTLSLRSSLADSSVSYSGGTYTQDFNSLWTNNTTPPYNILLDFPAPIQIGPATVGSAPIDLTGSSTDTQTTISQISTMTGWYATSFGGNSVPLGYNVTDGSSFTDSNGNITSFAQPALTAWFDPTDPANQAGNSPNLALGAVTASSTGNVVFGMKLINTGSLTLNSISLSYIGELFHQDASPKTMTFSYAVGDAASTLPTSNTTNVGLLNVGNFAPGASGAPDTTENLSVANLPLLTDWAPGQALWLTWGMTSAGGGQGLGIDNLSFTATHVDAYPTLTWNHAGDGAWDTTSQNWSPAGTTFANNSYNVVFPDAAADTTISVAPAGVTVQLSADINNNNPTTYTFTGGSIGGAAASVNINGTGTVRFTSPNSYGLATNLNAGTLVVDNNNELGDTAATLNFNGGKLQLAANLDGTTRSLVVSSAGGTIDLHGFNASFGANSSATPIIHGALEVSGGGNLNLGIQPTFGSQSAPAGHLVVDAGSSVTLVGNSRSSATDMYDGAVLNGNLILDTTSLGSRFNFDSPGDPADGVDHNGDSKITGTGEIQVVNGSGWIVGTKKNVSAWQLDTNGVVISNTAHTYGAEIDVPIHLNSTNKPFSALDVSTADFLDLNTNPNPANSFVTAIGGTKIGTQGHGPGFSNIIVKGVIYGNSDVNLGNDYSSGGSGDMTWYAHNTYTGATLVGGGGGLYTAINDALPPTTNIVFGALANSKTGFIDLDGHDQHVQSIEVALGSNSPQANYIQNSGDAPATLYITGDNTPFYPYNAQLNDGGTGTDGLTRSNTLALNKSGNGTLILGEYLAAGHSTTSTYSGGTTIAGGTLEIAFDGALGAPTGALTMDGGTLNIQNPYFIGSTDSSELTTAFSTDRPFSVTSNGGTITTPSFTATLQSNGQPVTLLEPVTFSGNGGYNWASTSAHPLALTGDAGSSFTLNGGSGAVQVTPGATIAVASGTSLSAGGASDPFTDSTNAANHVAIVNNGTFHITAGDKAVAAVTGAGNVTVDAGTSLTADSIQAGTLALHGTASLRTNGGTSVLTSISLDGASNNWTGHLDIANNKLVIQTISSNVSSVLPDLENAATFGKTHTAGITAAVEPANFGIAVVRNGDLPTPFASFGNVPVTSDNILVTSAVYGDINLDGKVDASDLAILASHWLQPSNHNWGVGDFTGSGTVDASDLALMSQNWLFGATGAGVSFASALAGFPAITSAVPEPASVLLLGLGAAALMSRRRRNA